MFTDLMIPFDDVFSRFDELMNSERLDFSKVFPPINVFCKADNKEITLELATSGYKKSELAVTVEGNKIVVTGSPVTEEKKGTYLGKQRIHKTPFTRSYEIPNTYDLERTSVTYEDGILSITVPVKETIAPAKRLLEIR